MHLLHMNKDPSSPVAIDLLLNRRDYPEGTEAQRGEALARDLDWCLPAQVQLGAQRLPPEGHLGAETGVLQAKRLGQGY